jgi:sensor histidine kinase YesM
VSLLTSKPLSYQPKYVAIAIFGIGLMVFFQSSTLDTNSSININIYHVILMFLYYSTWIYLIKFVNGAVHSLPEFREITFSSLGKFIVTGILLVLIHFTISNALYYPLRSLVSGNWQSPWAELIMILPKATLSRLIDFAVISSVLKIININKELNEKNLKLVNLESQLHQSQLMSLKAQLNPHFLFNSLHAVSSLIGYDDEKARNMTIKISGLLRKMLEDRDKQTHSLREELDYIEDYLAIEQERFFDRLEVKIEIQNGAHEAEIPNLLLQPLIENAFKHGISQLEGKGHIHINAFVTEEKDELIISLENSSPGTSAEPSMGVGLDNVSSRLQQLYGNSADLEIKSEDDLFVIVLRIPQTP